MSHRLPRGLETLLRFGLPGDQLEPIAGDLIEDYADRVRRHGKLRARVGLWAQAFRLTWRFRMEKTVHGRPLPPIADEIRRASMWDSIRQDVAFGVRMLRRQPGFTAVAVLALALGVGANTAIFSVVDAVLWRPLPFPRADEIAALGEARPREGRINGPVAPADFFDWRRDANSFSAMAAYDDIALNLTGTGEPERLRALSVTPGFLTAIGIGPALGRDFMADEETQGRHRVVLLTASFWRRRFAGDGTIVGRKVTFDGNPYEIAGVLPDRFWWPTRPDVLVPMALTEYDRTLRAAHFLDVVGRRRSGVSFEQAREEMAVIGARLSAEFPAENRNHTTSVLQLREALVGDTRTALLVLLGAVGLVLLIACANVATLMLARATTRQKELAIRMAVGGARARLVQQMLTESLVLAMAGGTVGLLLAVWSIAGLRGMLPAQFSALPGIDTVGLDARVLAAAFIVSLITGLAFGAAPALAASDQRVGATINEGARGSSAGGGGRRLRSTLVVAELALSLMLLVGAGLLMASFWNLTEVSPGFRPSQVVTTRLTLPFVRYPDHPHAVAFYQAVSERLRAMPGVERVAFSSAPPFSGLDGRLNLEVEDRTIESTIPVRAHPRSVSADYFQTLGIPLVQGRIFTDRDNADAPAVAIVNQSAVNRFWPGLNPIGERISVGSPQRWREIVGVVGDVKHEGLDTETTPEVYMPHLQEFTALGNALVRGLTLVVRTSSEMSSIAPLIRSAVAAVDDQQPVSLIRPMDDLIAQSVAPRRLNLLLLSVFAAVAVILTAAGLYGVMSYLVTQRTREIGVRMALGATPSSVLKLVLRQAGVMTMAGILLGLAGAFAVARSIGSLLFQVSATDPVIYGLVSLVLATVACLAIVIPCSRATRVDPLTALRQP
jgi:putative ABC transport system permease protein